MRSSSHVQTLNSYPSAEELEDRLLHALGIPVRRAAATSFDLPGSIGADLRLLNNLVRDLRLHAALVGEIPSNYPKHVDLIMRGVAAILPWYTRPLREYAQKTAGVMTSVAEVVCQLAARQQALEEFVSKRSRDENEGLPPRAA
jgi:hypothetical protein